MPAVIAAERHHVAAGRGACDPNGDRHGFAAGTAEADHIRPRVKVDQQFGKLDVLGAIQRRHRAQVDRGLHGRIDVRIGKTQDGGADAAIAHVEIGLAVEVDDLGAFGGLEIGRPLFRQEHFGTFRQQLSAAGHDFPRAPVKRLASACHLVLPPNSARRYPKPAPRASSVPPEKR